MIFIPDSVFPTNDHGQAICPKCKHPVKSCSCQVVQIPQPKTPEHQIKIRLEKSGRHGKIVTVIEGLSGDDHALKELAKTLKTKSGSGGTFYRNAHGGVIEVQGDHKDMIKKYFV